MSGSLAFPTPMVPDDMPNAPHTAGPAFATPMMPDVGPVGDLEFRMTPRPVTATSYDQLPTKDGGGRARAAAHADARRDAYATTKGLRAGRAPGRYRARWPAEQGSTGRGVA